MMKVLLLIGLSLLVDTRWVRSDSLLQSFKERQLGEKGSQLQALRLNRFLRNRQEHGGKTEFSAENKGADSLEDNSSEVKAEGLIILGDIRSDGNDSPLQSITDGDPVEKDSQYDELDISNKELVLKNILKDKTLDLFKEMIMMEVP